MYRLDAARTELTTLHVLPDDGQIHMGAEAGYYIPLGFTVYRTNYDDGTDALWEKLIDDLESKTKVSIRYKYRDNMHIPEEAEAVDKMISLVKMDPRSDKSLLEGLDDDQLRAIFNEGTGGTPLNTERARRHCFFFVADAAVFRRQRGKRPWVRVVEVDYEPEEHDEDAQTYWGWMKMATSSMFFFYGELLGLELWEMAPEMADMEKAKIYDGGVSEDDE